VVLAYNPSYSGGRDQEDCSLRQKKKKSLSRNIYPKQKRAGRMDQVVEHLPSKHEVLNSTPSIADKDGYTLESSTLLLFPDSKRS
jgi:hypothetical protein